MIVIYMPIVRVQTQKIGMTRLLLAHEIIFALSALSLFMALVLGADDHDLAVSFDDFAFVAHRFY